MLTNDWPSATLANDAQARVRQRQHTARDLYILDAWDRKCRKARLALLPGITLAYDSRYGRDAEPEDGDAHARFTAWLRDRLNPEDARVAEELLRACMEMAPARDDEPNMGVRGAERNPPTERLQRQPGMAQDADAAIRRHYQRKLQDRLALGVPAMKDFAKRWPGASRVRSLG